MANSNAVLGSEIQGYIASKSASEIDVRKKSFFEDIQNLSSQENLTIAKLTEQLAAKHSQFADLFYRGRSRGPSIDSRAAQLVKKLYIELGVPLDDNLLTRIVHQDIPEDLQNALKNFAYHEWKANKFLPENIERLERELKDFIGFTKPTDPTISLAQAIYDDPRNLIRSLTKIYERAPSYLPIFIDNLYAIVPEAEKASLSIELAQFAIFNPQFIKPLTSANVECSTALVQKRPYIFFHMSHSMQQAVLANLEQVEPNRETILELRGLPVLIRGGGSLDLGGPKEDLLNALEAYNDCDSTKPIANSDKQLLTDFILEQIDSLQGDALANDKKRKAFILIDNYLRKIPDDYKADFFRDLKESIAKQGLTVRLLQEKLQLTDRKKLFSVWLSDQSRSEELIKELYQLASNALDNEKFPENGRQALLDTGTLPAEKINSETDWINERVTEFLKHPEQAKYSEFGHVFERELSSLQAVYHLEQHEKNYQHNRAEAIYQQYIVEKGLELAKGKNDNIFDPQGHVLITVDLGLHDLHKILRRIAPRTDFSSVTDLNLSVVLSELLGGSKITSQTLCSLDIMHDQRLRDQFFAKLGVNNTDSLCQFLTSNNHSRSCIIPLQEEMSMHVSLCCRALEKAEQEKAAQGKGLSFSLDYKEALKDTIVTINAKVLEKFKKAFEEAKPAYQDSPNANNEDFFSSLNTALDKARLTLAEEAREILVAQLGKGLNENEVEELCDKVVNVLNKHDFTSTTATNLDYLHTDTQNETVVRITATDFTAHDKGIGRDKQALRLINRNHLTTNGPLQQVAPYHNVTQEARVPSIAVFAAKDSTTAIEDVADKLQHSYQLLASKHSQDAPIIYNLLTSLHTEFYEIFESKNKQRTSAEYILLGTHQFNQTQVKAGKPSQLVFVQNVPVNQHTKELDYHSFDDATAEAALMTDLALLATFNQHSAFFPPAISMEIASFYERAQARYVHFLSTSKDGKLGYFKDSRQGERLIKELEEKKAFWAQSICRPFTADKKSDEKSKDKKSDKKSIARDAAEAKLDNMTLETLVMQALFKMMVSDDYHDSQFGLLVQALSVFVEPVSEAGCKSANERYQSVAGRVNLLKSMSEKTNDKLSPEQKQVIQSLKGYVLNDVSINKVQKAVDRAYNKHKLYSANVSPQDQGGSFKVTAAVNRFFSRGYIFSPFNTNVAETGHLTSLKQKNAGGMQAHKAGLAQIFKELFTELLNKLKNNPVVEKSTDSPALN
ncbi:Uncharacterised protein [Legionella beliardensis]|uniref:Uncharacterized protein n=1 Tax=Legionella beliardensis TaxID=91822 RepID=A0A378I446_9GAMM|nr:hypothetical protein [Legionella beliardensis]STX29977.1 Uncharacterised protein [Legionella beliardensis]